MRVKRIRRDRRVPQAIAPKRSKQRLLGSVTAVNVLISVGIVAIAQLILATAQLTPVWLNSLLLGLQPQRHNQVNPLPPSEQNLGQPDTQAKLDPRYAATHSPDHPSDRFTPEEIRYFLEVALGSEFGDSTPEIKKWQGHIQINVYGFPTAEDLNTLRTVVTEINGLVDTIELDMTLRSPQNSANTSPTINLYFVPEAQFKRYEPNYEPLNYGFFWTWWDQDKLDRANVLISTTHVTQKERSHLIREELTQSLGLMNDSNRYADSIFYAPWTATTSYSEIDKALITLLYRPEIQAGMTRPQVVRVLSQLQAEDQRFPCSTAEIEGDRSGSESANCDRLLKNSILIRDNH